MLDLFFFPRAPGSIKLSRRGQKKKEEEIKNKSRNEPRPSPLVPGRGCACTAAARIYYTSEIISPAPPRVPRRVKRETSLSAQQVNNIHKSRRPFRSRSRRRVIVASLRARHSDIFNTARLRVSDRRKPITPRIGTIEKTGNKSKNQQS